MSRFIIAFIFVISISVLLGKSEAQIHAGSETPTTVVENTGIGLVEVPKTEPQGAGVQSGGDGCEFWQTWDCYPRLKKVWESGARIPDLKKKSGNSGRESRFTSISLP